ncbi:unnamed protein product, partial [Macrosiphum euphorbiae]
MKTRKLKNDGTDTVALETTDPAGVGKLATPVVITSLDYTQTNSETENLDINDTDMKNNRHCYFAPLRLR